MPTIEAQELNTQYWEPVATGPVAQVDLTTSTELSTNPPTTGTIAASGNYTSNVIPSDGFKAIGVGCTSNQTGNLQIQRYLDKAGLVPVGALVTAALTASTPQWATVNDGAPFQSFKIIISNTGASAATITNFALLLSAS